MDGRHKPARHGGQGGAETLELMGGLPLLALVLMVVWQGVVLMRDQAELESDARLLARAAVICGAESPSLLLLRAIDPQAHDVRLDHRYDEHTFMHTVSLTMAEQSVVPWGDGPRGPGFRPHAEVVMRAEPC